MENETLVEDRIVREHRETHALTLARYNGLAKHMPAWTVQVREVDQAWYGPHYSYKLVDSAGHAISLSACRGSANRGKIHVSGYWPMVSEHGPYTAPSDVREESPSINVSESRGFEVMARAITRRFIPEYFRIFQKIQDKIGADNAYQDRKANAWKRIAESGLVTNPRTRDSADPCAQVRIGRPGAIDYDKGYGDVRLTGEDSVQIELRSLPVETALRVLRALVGSNKLADTSLTNTPSAS